MHPDDWTERWFASLSTEVASTIDKDAAKQQKLLAMAASEIRSRSSLQASRIHMQTMAKQNCNGPLVLI